MSVEAADRFNNTVFATTCPRPAQLPAELNDKTKWLLGNPPCFLERKKGCTAKVVSFLTARSNCCVRISKLALAIFLSVILIASIIGIPIFLKALRERKIHLMEKNHNLQNQFLFRKIKGEREIWIQKMIEAPILEIQKPNELEQMKNKNYGFLNYIEVADLGDNTIMKGVDYLHRPFICVKVLNKQKESEELLTFYQHRLDEPQWYYTSSKDDKPQKASYQETLHKILSNTHPTYNLLPKA